VSTCVRPVRGKVSNIVTVYQTPVGPVEIDQGRKIAFFYEDGSATWLAETSVDGEFPHAWVN
jgi:hypothetical protein